MITVATTLTTRASWGRVIWFMIHSGRVSTPGGAVKMVTAGRAGQPEENLRAIIGARCGIRARSCIQRGKDPLGYFLPHPADAERPVHESRLHRRTVLLRPGPLQVDRTLSTLRWSRPPPRRPRRKPQGYGRRRLQACPQRVRADRIARPGASTGRHPEKWYAGVRRASPHRYTRQAQATGRGCRYGPRGIRE